MKNFLAGLGSISNPLGTMPKYHVPRIGDRVIDEQKISSGWQSVARGLEKNINKAIRDDKRAKYGTSKK